MTHKLAVGDKVTLPVDRIAWYSGYCGRELIIRADEVGIVTAVDVPVVRRVDGRNSYAVAQFGDKQIDLNPGDYSIVVQ